MIKYIPGRVLLEEEVIKKRVSEMGAELSEYYRGSEKPPVLVCVLKGALVFTSDLARAIDIDIELDFMRVSSYGGGTESSGSINIKKDLDADVTGRDVLIIDDIIDSGNTLSSLKRLLGDRGAKSVKLCAFLDKPERREADIEADFVGFVIENEFIVGYGLDYDEHYRNLPYIAVAEE